MLGGVWHKKYEDCVCVLKMRVRSTQGVSLGDKMRNSVIRERCAVKNDLVRGVIKKMRCSRHMKIMDFSKIRT